MRLNILNVFSLLVLAAVVRICPAEKSDRWAQADCLARFLPLPMIKDMIKTLKSISQPSQIDSRHHKRYVPKFCIKKLNIADIHKMLGIYEDHVFKKLWSNDTEYPKRFIHSFNTLKVNVDRCKEKGQAKLSRNTRKKIKGMEETFRKLQPDDLLKAAGDFEMILRWISQYTDKKLTPSKCQ